jgi:hypothetical protein
MASYTALAAANLITPVQAIKLQAFDTMVKMKAVPQSVFFNIPAEDVNEFSQDNIAIPGEFIMKKAPGQDKSHQTNFPMLKYLSGNATQGNAENQIDNIEDPVLKEFTGYFNDCSHATKLDQYGINSIDSAPYVDQAKIAQLLGVHHSEIMDYYMEYALLMGRSPNLLESPINLTGVMHRNTFVKGLNYGSQPYNSYNTNANFWAGVIASFMDLADTNHATKTDLACDIGFVLAMSKWANYTGKFPKFNLGGRKSYVYVLPVSQIEYLINPANQDAPGYWSFIGAGLNSVEQTIPGAKIRINDVIIVENGRAPTAKIYGSGSGSGSGVASTNPSNAVIEIKYCKAGDTDERHTTGTIWEPGFFISPSAIAQIDAGLHTEYEIQDFQRIKATGWFNTYGLNRVDYDLDTKTTTSINNFSSAVTWFEQQSSAFNNG